MGFFTGKSASLKTFSTISDWQKNLGQSMANLFKGMAPEAISRLFEREDPFSIVKEFEETFATPVMRMWKRDIAPMVAEGFNMFPGSFYSKSRFTGMQREAEEFMSGKVSPLLFSALEGARGRELQRQSLMANVIGLPAQLAVSPTVSGSMRPAGAAPFNQIMSGLSGAGSFGADISSIGTDKAMIDYLERMG